MFSCSALTESVGVLCVCVCAWVVVGAGGVQRGTCSDRGGRNLGQCIVSGLGSSSVWMAPFSQHETLLCAWGYIHAPTQWGGGGGVDVLNMISVLANLTQFAFLTSSIIFRLK